MKHKKVIVFDLDDTLYNEIDYLKSAYNEIASNISKELDVEKHIVFQEMLELYNNKRNVFDDIIKKYNSSYTKEELLNLYRNHKPSIKLSNDRLNFIKLLHEKGVSMGVLTDGRITQQRNKLKALGVLNYISHIIISEEFGTEKPDFNNYKYFENVFGECQYYYIGDNIKKDFITPNSLNWITVRVLDNGLNIHKHKDSDFNKKYLAQFNIINFNQLKTILNL